MITWHEDKLHKEESINKVIAKMFEKTADAMLVDKYFHNEIQDNFTYEFILTSNKEAYLNEAKRREEETKALNKVRLA